MTPFEERLLELTRNGGVQKTAPQRSMAVMNELITQMQEQGVPYPVIEDTMAVLKNDNFINTLSKTNFKSGPTAPQRTLSIIMDAISSAGDSVLGTLKSTPQQIASALSAAPDKLMATVRSIDPGFDEKLDRALGNSTSGASGSWDAAVSGGATGTWEDTIPLGNEGRRAGGGVTDTVIPLGNEFRRAGGNNLPMDALGNEHRRAGGTVSSPLDDTLLALTTAGSTAPLPVAPTVAPNPVGTGKSTLFTNIEDVAAGAEAAGQKVVRVGMPKTKPGQPTAIDTQIKETPNIASTPDYSALNNLQQRLATATGDEKIDLAFQLKMMAQSQAMDDYGKFVKQAETRFGIPDIEANIRTLTEMENVDPNRPPGVMSDQRKAALNMLGAARIQSRAYTEELMKGNTGVQKAILQAESVLSSFKLDDDKIRLSEARAEQAYRTAQKMDFLANPKLLNRINAMQTGNFISSQEMRDATATKLAVKSDPKLLELANLDKNSIYELMLDPKYKDVDKSKLKNMLIADEVSVTGNVEKAKARMQLIDTVISDSLKLDADKLESLGITIPKSAEADVLKEMSNYKKGVKEATSSAANIGKSNAEKNAAVGTLSAIAKRKILEILTLNDFKENVNSWQGLIQSDPTASALLAKVDKSKPYNMNAFIADYLNTKDDKTLPQKAEALRQIVSSGVGANNKGSLLPELNPDSIVMSIDRLAAASVAATTFANIRADSWAGYQEQYRNISNTISNP